MNNEEEFKLVKSKKKKPNRRKLSAVQKQNCTINIPYTLEKDFILRRFTKFQEELCHSEFYLSIKSQIEALIDEHIKPMKIICLGLGTLNTTKPSPYYQLAFILELQKDFKISTLEIYDPIFNEIDKEIFEALGCQISKDNLRGRYKLDCVTIFYLPHCPRSLTNNLLWTNWSKDKLKDVILIANSFDSIRTDIPSRILMENHKFIYKISGFTEEYPFEIKLDEFDNAFYQTSVHIFKNEKLKSVSVEFWTEVDEPESKYSIDDEIVYNCTLLENISL